MEEAPSPSRFPAGQAETSHSLTPFQRLANEQVHRLLILLRREVRRDGSSLGELEFALGWRRGYLSQLLRGAIYLKAHHFFSLAKALDFDAGELLATLCADGEDEEDEVGDPAAGGPPLEARAVLNIQRLVAELVEDHLGRSAIPADGEGRNRLPQPNYSYPVGQEEGSPKELAERLLAHLRQTIFDREVTLRDLAKILDWGKGTVYATLSERAQVTMRCLFEVLAGLDVDPGRFFRDFFGPLPNGRGRDEAQADPSSSGASEGEAESKSSPFDETTLLRLALRSLLRPMVVELVEEHLASRLDDE